jgi:hypothetical protein
LRRAYSQTLGLTVLALTATGFASAALAQTAAPASAPSRYLNWAGRGDVAMPGVTEAPTQPGAPQRRPNRVIPHGGVYEAPAPIPATITDAPRRTLTPANAWMRPPAPAPAPVPVAMTAPPPPAPRTVPDFVPDRGGRGQPAPAEAVLASPPPAAPVAAPVDDPMAPRRDAPIFRMQQTPSPAPVQASPAPQGQAEAAPAPAAAEPRRVAMVTANPDDRPAQQGARYYSVHRQAGREPDGLSLPQPTYVDALAITTPVTVATQDLAQPDQAPTLIRDAQGRVRAQPAAPEGDYQ